MLNNELVAGLIGLVYVQLQLINRDGIFFSVFALSLAYSAVTVLSVGTF